VLLEENNNTLAAGIGQKLLDLATRP